MNDLLGEEFERDIRSRVNPQYADTRGTESYERKRLLGEIDRLRSALKDIHDSPDGARLKASKALTPNVDGQSRLTAGLAVFVTPQKIKDLRRFDETCEDGEGYDVPKIRMIALMNAGLLARTRGIYTITDFGEYILEATSQDEGQSGGLEGEFSPDWVGYRQGFDDGVDTTADEFAHLCRDLSAGIGHIYLGDVLAYLGTIKTRIKKTSN